MRDFKAFSIPHPPLAPPSWLMSPSINKELEIGAGDGEFALQKAQEKPDCHFIAIEKSRRLFDRMQNQCHKKNRPNLWIFHTNAIWWVTHFVPQNSLNKIYILYPNPYTKNRQKNLRWFNRPFMPFLLKRLKRGGELEISTNNKNYYEEIKQKTHSYPSIQQTHDLVLRPKEQEPRTAFERKYMARGDTCHSLIYTKIGEHL